MLTACLEAILGLRRKHIVPGSQQGCTDPCDCMQTRKTTQPALVSVFELTGEGGDYSQNGEPPALRRRRHSACATGPEKQACMAFGQREKSGSNDAAKGLRTAPSVRTMCPARCLAPCSSRPTPRVRRTMPSAMARLGAGSVGRLGVPRLA